MHIFDETFGVGSVHDDLGRNGLRSAGAQPVYLTLRNDGSTSELHNAQVLGLAATSVFERGDISATRGVLQGNDLNNHLVGGAQDEIFETGGGNTSIVTGGGSDVLLVSQDAQRVRLTDFHINTTRLAFADISPLTVLPTRDGLILRTATGSTVEIPNIVNVDMSNTVVDRKVLPRGQLRPPQAPVSAPAAGGNSTGGGAPRQGNQAP